MLRQQEEGTVKSSPLIANARIEPIPAPSSAACKATETKKRRASQYLLPVRLNRKQKQVAFWLPIFYSLCGALLSPLTASSTLSLLKGVELFLSTGGLFLLLLWLGFYVRYKRAALAATAWLYFISFVFIIGYTVVFPGRPSAARSTRHHAPAPWLHLWESLFLLMALSFVTALTGAWLGQKLRGHQALYGSDEER